MRYKDILLITVSGAKFAVVPPAKAQNTASSPAPNLGIEEAVVTAQRRSERLQDVLVAVPL